MCSYDDTVGWHQLTAVHIQVLCQTFDDYTVFCVYVSMCAFPTIIIIRAQIL